MPIETRSRLCQSAAKAVAPSSWSFAASASRSTPAWLKWVSRSSTSPPRAGSALFAVVNESLEGLVGMVLIVSGAARPSAQSVPGASGSLFAPRRAGPRPESWPQPELCAPPASGTGRPSGLCERIAGIGSRVSRNRAADVGPAGLVTRAMSRHVILVAAVTALGGLLFGYDTGVVSGALLFIHRAFGPVSSFDKELVVSLLLVGAVVGALGAGRIADRIGRRPTLLLRWTPMSRA